MRYASILALIATASAPLAQESSDLPAGHSQHGEAFNEGPRQRAKLMPGTGNVHFAVTTKTEMAQRFFDQGLGQLHGFWYLESERSFRQAAALDPACAMTYWGMAMANVENEERARGFAAEAWKRRKSCSRHERMYIEAIAKRYEVAIDEPAGKKSKTPDKSKTDKPKAAKPKAAKAKAAKAKRKPRKKTDPKKLRRAYVQDLEKLIYEFPDDIEAKALLANQLWLDVRRGFPIHSKQANQALLDQVFAKNPMHPAHHYRIHLWDKKETAYRVVDSAVKSGNSAPGIAHMWHMGGHTFDKLARFDDAAWQQEASARVDHGYMMRERVMPFLIHNYAHNQEWCVRSLLKVGRVSDALALAKNLIELPRHPKLNHLGRRGAASYGQMRLVDTLLDAEMWDEAIALAETVYLDAGGEPAARANRSYVLGRALLAKGRTADARKHVASLATCIRDQKRKRADSVDEAEETAIEEGKPRKEVDAAMAKALAKHNGVLGRMRTQRSTLEALASFANGKHEDALKALAKAKADKLLIARHHLRAGDKKKAKKLALEGIKNRRKHAFPLANLVDLLWQCGDRAAAKKELAKLREISAKFELDAAPFQRLAPIAKALGHSDDWRTPLGIPKDVGERPPLESLGPFRWSPTLAPEWSLARSDGKKLSLADYRGKPVLVVFFLGFGCVHCVEQLQALKPMAGQFAKAGIDIVTIGTDELQAVSVAVKEKGRDFSFPILSDPDRSAFRAYHCWDDFENQPLHGTFLVDANGLVRWQDISFEPFMETEFLLEECKRLLALPLDSATVNGARSPR